mmetsp:Transcript_82608/g.242413  ORF Transcript_82608/g.242413 Transcript_82608/m.242413 type:complete len:200 (-) Transcript_82608:451-1050(-)
MAVRVSRMSCAFRSMLKLMKTQVIVLTSARLCTRKRHSSARYSSNGNHSSIRSLTGILRLPVVFEGVIEYFSCSEDSWYMPKAVGETVLHCASGRVAKTGSNSWSICSQRPRQSSRELKKQVRLHKKSSSTAFSTSGASGFSAWLLSPLSQVRSFARRSSAASHCISACMVPRTVSAIMPMYSIIVANSCMCTSSTVCR